MEEKEVEFLEKEQSPAVRFLLAKTDRLEKDYGRLCQNDSIMRTELHVAIKRLDKQNEEINDLKLIITKLHNECQRLYMTGFSNGVEVAKEEYAAELKRLEDTGLITCHGFLRNEEVDKLTATLYDQLGIHTNKIEPASATFVADEAWRKFAEVHVDNFKRGDILSKEQLYNQMKVTPIDPVEADYYKQVDKAIKDEE